VIARRIFLIGLPSACALVGALARPPALQAPKTIGLLFPWKSDDVTENTDLFVRAMGEIGYVKDDHFTLVTRMSDGHYERLVGYAAELVRLKVDLIFAASTIAVSAARGATTSIPIVFIYVTDPVGAGFAESLAHPGHNVTGLANITLDLNAKRLQLLKDMLPGLVRVAYLVNPKSAPPVIATANGIQKLAEPLRLQTFIVNASGRAELEVAFGEMTGERAQALLVSGDPLLWNLRQEIAGLALRHRLPSMWSSADCAEAGGLMSYGNDFSEVDRELAGYVDKIFNGARPGELAIQQPSKFLLVINGRTANALSIPIPQGLRARAERVIE